jgi:hypothetical protein
MQHRNRSAAARLGSIMLLPALLNLLLTLLLPLRGE